MKSGDRVVLELSHEQAVVLERAVELLFRLHMGQFEDIKWALMPRLCGTEWDPQNINAALELLKMAIFPGLKLGESFNINCCDECNIAYNIYQAIRFVNAWHQNPSGGIGVAFDPPHPTGKPIPKCYLVEEGEAHENNG